MREQRNVIESISNVGMTKKEFIDLLNKEFPDEEVGTHGRIVQITTTRLTDGTVNQSVLLGKQLRV